MLWFTGEDIPFVPNKRFGGVCLGGKIAPIFFNTMEDAARCREIDVSQMEMGDVIELIVRTGKALPPGMARSSPNRPEVWSSLDEVLPAAAFR